MNNKKLSQDHPESCGRQHYQQNASLEETTQIGLNETSLMTDFVSSRSSTAYLDNGGYLYNHTNQDNDANKDDSVIENEEPTPQTNSFSLQLPNLMYDHEIPNSSVQIQVDNALELETTTQRLRQRVLSLNKITQLSNHKMSSLKEFVVLNAFCHLTGFITEAYSLPYFIVFIMIIVMNFVMVARTLTGYPDTSSASYRIRSLVFRISNWTCLTAYFVVAILKYYGETVNLSPWTIPGCLSIFLESFFMSSTYTSSERGLEISLKYAIWVQLFIVALKFDNATTPWTFTLFVFISFGFISLMIATILLVLCISAILGVPYYNVAGKIAVMGCGWYFLISLSNVLWGFIVIYIENMLNTQNHQIPLKMFFLIGLLYATLLIIFTKIINKTLFIFLKYEAIQELQDIGDLPDRNYNILLASDKRFKHHYLAKITETYYSTLEKNLQIQDKEILNKWSKEINRAKFYKSSPTKHFQTCVKSTSVSPTFQITNSYKIKRSCSLDNFNNLLNKKVRNNEEKISPSYREDREPCFVCYEVDANAVVMDCGHGGICYECAVKGWERSDKCHMCRGEIRIILKVKTLTNTKLVKVVHQIEKVSNEDLILNA